MADLGAAVNLSRFSFDDPLAATLKELGTTNSLKDFPYINPFESLELPSYRNMALSFAGNPQLTTSAGLMPPVEAGRLLLRDEIRQGKTALFSGVISTR